jgi:hypothetical protein
LKQARLFVIRRRKIIAQTPPVVSRLELEEKTTKESLRALFL